MGTLQPILDAHNTDREAEPLFVRRRETRIYRPMLADSPPQTDLTMVLYHLEARFESDLAGDCQDGNTL